MSQNLSLKINGTSHAQTQPDSVTRAEALKAFDHVLRAIALSDSPVLVQGGNKDTRAQIAERLHNLGRRAEQPLRICSSARDCTKLITNLFEDASWDKTLGTWVLRGVTEWAIDRQKELTNFLERLDQQRFSVGAKHDKVPRVIVLLGESEEKESLSPQLQQRLSFFNISLTATSLEMSR